MRSTVGGLRSLFAKVPAPYTTSYGTTGVSGMAALGGARGDRQSQLQAMGGNGTLFGIVGQLANGASRVKWHLYRKRTDNRRRFGPPVDDRVEVLQHQALNVLQRPNPFMPWQEFCETTQQHVRLVGEGWWAIEYAGTVPFRLWPVRPDRIAPVPDKDEFISGYVYQSPDGETVPLGVNEVIMLRQPDPWDVYRGMGAVQTILADVHSAAYAAEWNKNFFLNSAMPGGLIELEVSLTDEKFKQMLARWRESHQGVSNAHRVGILEMGKWKDRQFSMKDMEFSALRNVHREIIREAFAYPKFLLGDPNDSNRASAIAAEYLEARRLLIPDLERIKAALNSEFLPLFGNGDSLEFDYESPVPADEDADAKVTLTRAQAWQILTGGGVDPEQALEAVGLPAMDVEEPAPPPPQLVPVPAAPGDPAEPGDPAGDPPEDPAADPDDGAQVAARALELLRSGGLARGILNGHSHARHAGTGRRGR